MKFLGTQTILSEQHLPEMSQLEIGGILAQECE